MLVLVYTNWIKSWTNNKFSMNSAATNSKKSIHIIHKKCFLEFHSPKLGMCIIYKCMFFMTNYDIKNRINSWLVKIKKPFTSLNFEMSYYHSKNCIFVVTWLFVFIHLSQRKIEMFIFSVGPIMYMGSLGNCPILSELPFLG